MTYFDFVYYCVYIYIYIFEKH